MEVLSLSWCTFWVPAGTSGKWQLISWVILPNFILHPLNLTMTFSERLKGSRELMVFSVSDIPIKLPLNPFLQKLSRLNFNSLHYFPVLVLFLQIFFWALNGISASFGNVDTRSGNGVLPGVRSHMQKHFSPFSNYIESSHWVYYLWCHTGFQKKNKNLTLLI